MEWRAVVRQQAIAWSNVDSDLCRHMASLRHNKLIVIWATKSKFQRNCNQYNQFFCQENIYIKMSSEKWEIWVVFLNVSITN